MSEGDRTQQKEDPPVVERADVFGVDPDRLGPCPPLSDPHYAECNESPLDPGLIGSENRAADLWINANHER